MSISCKSLLVITLLTHLVVIVKGQLAVDCNVTVLPKTIEEECTWQVIDSSSYLPLISCKPFADAANRTIRFPMPYDGFDFVTRYIAENCTVETELGTNPVHCVVDESTTNITELTVALAHARNISTTCAKKDTCLTWALKSHEEDTITTINGTLQEISLEKCDTTCNFTSGLIPDKFRCNADFISELARGRVIGDMKNKLSPEQKFIRYICYMSKDFDATRESLFSPFLGTNDTLTPYMRATVKICPYSELLSCKTVTIDVGGTKKKVSTCQCNDYDAIEDKDGNCLAKPLTPCRFKNHDYGQSILQTKIITCVKHATCKDVDTSDLKDRFLAFYEGLYHDDFIKEFIISETSHACDCDPGYIPIAAGHCISDSTKPSIFPLLLLFTAALLLLCGPGESTKIHF